MEASGVITTRKGTRFPFPNQFVPCKHTHTHTEYQIIGFCRLASSSNYVMIAVWELWGWNRRKNALHHINIIWIIRIQTECETNHTIIKCKIIVATGVAVAAAKICCFQSYFFIDFWPNMVETTSDVCCTRIECVLLANWMEYWWQKRTKQSIRSFRNGIEFKPRSKRRKNMAFTSKRKKKRKQNAWTMWLFQFSFT